MSLGRVISQYARPGMMVIFHSHCRYVSKPNDIGRSDRKCVVGIHLTKNLRSVSGAVGKLREPIFWDFIISIQCLFVYLYIYSNLCWLACMYSSDGIHMGFHRQICSPFGTFGTTPARIHTITQLCERYLFFSYLISFLFCSTALGVSLLRL